MSNYDESWRSPSPSQPHNDLFPVSPFSNVEDEIRHRGIIEQIAYSLPVAPLT